MDDVNRTTSMNRTTSARRTTSTKRAMHVVVVVVSAVSLSGCGWFMYRSNAAHTGESVGERVIGVDNVASLSEAWTTSQEVVVGRDLVVAGGRLYVHANGGLSAFDADGSDNCGGVPKACAPVWKAEPGGGVTPAVVGGVVYDVGSGVLSAYDAAGNTGCSGSPQRASPCGQLRSATSNLTRRRSRAASGT